MDIAPLFPFGHGLSYTNFKLSDLKIERFPSEKVIVHTTVTNTGRRPGAEVIQAYIGHQSPRINRPPKELKGFQKVFLDVGAKAVVKIVLDVAYATSFWDEYRSKWCSEAGMYKVLVGTSSAGEHLSDSFHVDRTSYWKGL